MHVAIVGAGTMGVRLALRCSAHGCATTLISRDAERAARGLAEASRESGIGAVGVTVSAQLADAAAAQLVAEVIPEDLAAKQALYARLEALLGDGVPIASGTSSLLPDALGARMRVPGRLIVAHMVHPVTVFPIVELVAPSGPEPGALAIVEAWLARLAMRPVRLRRAVTGFIVNRLQFALLREAASLVENDVASAQDVDAIVELALGPRWAATGPLASAALGGQRTFAGIARQVLPALDRRLQIALLEAEAPVRAWEANEAQTARALRSEMFAAIERVRERRSEARQMQIAPYLFFDGNCEEALHFYAGVFGGKITAMNRFADSPMGASMAPEERNRVMHATFEAPGASFMASDGDEQSAGEMRRVSLSVGLDDAGEGRRIFDALATGGSVAMPYEKQFWGASFGMLVDRFGIRWMVNAG